MANEQIKVGAQINAPKSKVWKYWTEPKHIVNWNFASDDWCCPKSESDLQVGGRFSYTMASKDNTMSFDFAGEFTKVELESILEYRLDDGREVTIQFSEDGEQTELLEIFEAEKTNTIEMQKAGWQAILDNFKHYVEK